MSHTHSVLMAGEQLIGTDDPLPEGHRYVDGVQYRLVRREDVLEGAIRRVQAAVHAAQSPIVPSGDTPLVISVADGRALLAFAMENR